jgi:hypothetical protein
MGNADFFVSSASSAVRTHPARPITRQRWCPFVRLFVACVRLMSYVQALSPQKVDKVEAVEEEEDLPKYRPSSTKWMEWLAIDPANPDHAPLVQCAPAYPDPTMCACSATAAPRAWPCAPSRALVRAASLARSRPAVRAVHMAPFEFHCDPVSAQRPPTAVLCSAQVCFRGDERAASEAMGRQAPNSPAAAYQHSPALVSAHG